MIFLINSSFIADSFLTAHMVIYCYIYHKFYPSCLAVSECLLLPWSRIKHSYKSKFLLKAAGICQVNFIYESSIFNKIILMTLYM